MLKKLFNPNIILSIGVLLAITVSWLFIPGWGDDPGEMYVLIGFAVGSVFSIVRNYFSILKDHRAITTPSPSDSPLLPTSPEAIRLGRGGRVSWINRRGATSADLTRHSKLVITGPMKIGKSREAAELIRLALDAGLVGEAAVYQPGPVFRFLDPGSLQTALRRSLAANQALLLFVDDLPFHYAGEGLDKLAAGIKALVDLCPKVYVLATAREDQLTGQHDAWLAEHGFHELELPALDAAQTASLVDRAGGVFDLQIDERAKEQFVQHRDGTPETLLNNLRLLHQQEHTHVDQALAAAVAPRTLAQSWEYLRSYIRERQPAAGYIIAALAAFHAAGVDRYTALVLAYAGRLWRQEKRWGRPWRRRAALRRALAYLGHFDILEEKGLLRYPDIFVEGLADAASARADLASFLLRHRRLFHNRWLRRFYPQAENHAWALFDLAYQAFKRKEYTAAVQLYTPSLGLLPHYGLSNNRGLAYAKQGDHTLAIQDYDRAIQLNPEYAAAYNNRGNAKGALGDSAAAIQDYDQAIRLDPEDAAAYNNRGIAYAKQGDDKRAIQDYDLAIKNNPEYATAYNNRGNAKAALGDPASAIQDYDQAIQLNPEFAAAYYNRGNAKDDLGDTAGAIQDYDQAIRLDPEGAAAIRNRARAYLQLEQPDQAEADCQTAEQLAPDDANTHAVWGWLHYARGQHAAAITRLQQANQAADDPTFANFDLALPLLCLGRHTEALEHIQARLAAHPQPDDLNDMLPYYQRLAAAQPELPGVQAALALLQAALP
ncbi:MAG: tetratricopeptide repeat protein [Anaerolineae bacterium]|nr:tetratricopeptide repeat protein [Anaerolineae bacterium]